MTDAQQQPEEDLYALTSEQMRAKAAELGISEEQLSVPEYPDFIDEKGFKLMIVEAKNTTSPKGSSQVELNLVALDENDKPVKYARSKLWLTYPFNNSVWKFRDTDGLERAFNTMQTLVRCGGAPEYAAPRKVQDGTKAHYFDQDDQPLVGKAKASYDLRVRIRVMEELRRREKNAAAWVGTVFYAQRKINEKDGKIYKNWQNISALPMTDRVEYIFNGPQMLTRRQHSENDQQGHEEDDLF